MRGFVPLAQTGVRLRPRLLENVIASLFGGVDSFKRQLRSGVRYSGAHQWIRSVASMSRCSASAGSPIRHRTGPCTPLSADKGSRVGCIVETGYPQGDIPGFSVL
jgi:hypothetical protein